MRPWLAMRDVLEAGRVRVPRVLSRDVDRGFLLLEDLGAQTYLQVITDTNADELFDAAVTQLLRLQAIAPPADLPAYDEALLAANCACSTSGPRPAPRARARLRRPRKPRRGLPRADRRGARAADGAGASRFHAPQPDADR